MCPAAAERVGDPAGAPLTRVIATRPGGARIRPAARGCWYGSRRWRAPLALRRRGVDEVPGRRWAGSHAKPSFARRDPRASDLADGRGALRLCFRSGAEKSTPTPEGRRRKPSRRSIVRVVDVATSILISLSTRALPAVPASACRWSTSRSDNHACAAAAADEGGRHRGRSALEGLTRALCPPRRARDRTRGRKFAASMSTSLVVSGPTSLARPHDALRLPHGGPGVVRGDEPGTSGVRACNMARLIVSMRG